MKNFLLIVLCGFLIGCSTSDKSNERFKAFEIVDHCHGSKVIYSGKGSCSVVDKSVKAFHDDEGVKRVKVFGYGELTQL